METNCVETNSSGDELLETNRKETNCLETKSSGHELCGHELCGNE